MIFSEILEKHLEHLGIIFDKLRQHRLKLKLKKCSSLKKERHIISGSLLVKMALSQITRKLKLLDLCLLQLVSKRSGHFLACAHITDVLFQTSVK